MLIWRARWAILAIIAAPRRRVPGAQQQGERFLWDLDRLDRPGLLIVGVASFVWGLLTFRSQEFVITSRRIIHAEGVINKRATELSLEKINDAVLDGVDSGASSASATSRS